MADIIEAKESTVKDFLEVLFRRKWIILGVVFISTAIVIYMNLREPAVFESTGKMLVKRGETQGVFNTYVRTLTWEEEIASQIEMVKSQVVVNRARELVRSYLPEGYETDEKVEYGRLTSGVISTSNVLYVTYSGLDAIFCEAAVNAIVNSYKEYYQQIRTPPEMEDFFSAELNIVKEDIEYWRERKMTLEKEWGIVDMQFQQRNTLNRLERYQTSLEEVTKLRIELENVIASLESFRELDVETLASLTNSLTEHEVKKTKLESFSDKIIELKMDESELSVTYTDDHKAMKKIRKQISDIYELMEQEIESKMNIQRQKLEIIRNREELLLGMLEGVVSEKDSYPAKESELNRINKTLDGLEKRYAKLQEQHMNSRINIASNPEWSITILAPATPAYQKKTRDYVRMALGPLFSLVIALGFAFFLDNLDHSIKNVSEAEEVLGHQVLSSFPDLDRK